MAVLYVKEQGSIIRKISQRIAVTKGNLSLLEIPISSIDNIAVIGNVQLTTQALHELLYEGIDVSFFTFSGKYIGKTSSDTSKNIFLRFAQYELYNNLEGRLLVAKAVVENKIANQIAMLRQHQYDGGEYDWKADIRSLEEVLQKLPEKKTSNEIMGVEGICSHIYFKAYGAMFHCDFTFDGRNRRPPKDPINVLISLGYTFLTKEVSAVLEAESFEMYLGFLHGIRYGRKSLALDIVEEFRQPVIDRLVLRLCNKRIINSFDFEIEEDRVILNEEGFRKFCKEFEKWMNGTLDRNFRGIIKGQVSKLKKAVQKKENYVPYRMEG